MVMSYTAIPYQDRVSNNQDQTKKSAGMTNNEKVVTTNGFVVGSNKHRSSNKHSSTVVANGYHHSRHASVRRLSTAMATNGNNYNQEQEIYEGFTFFAQQQQRGQNHYYHGNQKFSSLFYHKCWSSICCCQASSANPNLSNSNHNHVMTNNNRKSKWCNFINPFAFKDQVLESIYDKYFCMMYKASLLNCFFVFLLLLAIIQFGLEFDWLLDKNKKHAWSWDVDCVPMWLNVALLILSLLPLIYMNCTSCVRPLPKLSLLKCVSIVTCFVLFLAVSPIWYFKRTKGVAITTVGLWQMLWLILLISCLLSVSIYTLIGLSLIIWIGYILSVIITILLSTNQTSTIAFSTLHWISFSGVSILFITIILIGCIINYLQQRLMRNAFMKTHEFLNYCVQVKLSNEKLDRLLTCIAPPPLLPELRQSPLVLLDNGASLQQGGTGANPNNNPSVVHLRNISVVNIELCGMSHIINSMNLSTSLNGGDSSGFQMYNKSQIHNSSNGNSPGNYGNIAADAVKLLNELFSRFDMLGQELGCYRIRAHPDDYLALAGYPETRVDHAKSCTELAIRIHQTVANLCDNTRIQLPQGGEQTVRLQVRAAVHTGTTYGTVLGHDRALFDLLGDDIRVVRQMLAVAEPGKVIVSKTTYDQLPDGYKGEPGPRMDVALVSMSLSSTSVDPGRIETFIIKPKSKKQSSILGGINNELAGIVTSTETAEAGNELDNRERENGIEPCNLQNTNGTPVLIFSQLDDYHPVPANDNATISITKSTVLAKFAQTAKFNVNLPYYFLHDDSFFMSPTPPSSFEDRLFFDLGNNPMSPANITNTLHPVNPNSPTFQGTTKSIMSWKSTLRSQLTQSLIGASYQIEEDEISLKKQSEINLSISKLFGSFNNSVIEMKFQNNAENYLGTSLMICLSTILLMGSLHALLLAKTVILLLLFLVIFMWIGLMLLLLLLTKMKCISGHVVKYRLSCVIILTVTCLGMFALFSGNSFCCNTDPPPPSSSLSATSLSNSNTTNMPRPSLLQSSIKPIQKYNLIQSEPHLECPLPIYILLSTIIILLPLIIMFSVPQNVKATIIITTLVCNCVIVFWTHNQIFQHYSASISYPIPIHLELIWIMQLFFSLLIMFESRVLDSFRRLEYQWTVKNSLKQEESHKLSTNIDRVVDILLPKFVSYQLLNSPNTYMNLYSSEHRQISVMSICIASWCGAGLQEPANVAANIRLLNATLIAFDELIAGSEFEGVEKIRTAGETVWYAVGLEDMDWHNVEGCGDNVDVETVRRGRQHKITLTLLYAAELMKKIVEEHNMKNPEVRFPVRIGIHTGTGYSGVVGGTKPEYGVWGDAYSGATLVQRYGQLDRIHVTYQFLSEIDQSYRSNFYDVGSLYVDGAGLLVPANSSATQICLRVLVLRERTTSPYGNTTPTNQQQLQHQNLVSICSDDSVFPVTIAPQMTQLYRNSVSMVASLADSSYNQSASLLMMSPPNMANSPQSLLSSSINPAATAMLPTANQMKPYNAIQPISHITNPLSPIGTSVAQQQQQIMSPSQQQQIMSPSQQQQQLNDLRVNNISGPISNVALLPSKQRHHNNEDNRIRVYRYKNLATELPDSIIPPSPPPHRRTYSEEKSNESQQIHPPLIPPRTNNCNINNNKDFIVMSQSELLANKPIQQKLLANNLRPVTPSSSIDSFLELEKVCSTTNPRSTSKSVGSQLATMAVSNGNTNGERLSQIPESGALYHHVNTSHHNGEDDVDDDEDGVEEEDDLDMVSMDVMTTSDDRVLGGGGTDFYDTSSSFAIGGSRPNFPTAFSANDQLDIMSHHNPIYTDNEYESMAESQVNLVDHNQLHHHLNRVEVPSANYNQDNRINSMMNNMMCLDFPDYRRPMSPPLPGNGDDSDHMSKKHNNNNPSQPNNNNNNNSSSNSSAAGQRISNNNSKRVTSSSSSSYGGPGAAIAGPTDSSGVAISDNVANGCSGNNNNVRSNRDSSGSNSGNQASGSEMGRNRFIMVEKENVERPKLDQSLGEEENDNRFVVTKQQQQQMKQHHINVSQPNDNASSCMSLVTDLGWTSCDDEEDVDDDDDDDGVNDYRQHRYRNKQLSNLEEISQQQFYDDMDNEDESDLDCIRLHSDLISDYSENPLVSDLDNETDYELRSNEKLSSFYRFPANNLLNNAANYYGNKEHMLNSDDNNQLILGPSQAWQKNHKAISGSINDQSDMEDIYSFPASSCCQDDEDNKDNQNVTPIKQKSTNSDISQSESLANHSEPIKPSKLPLIAPVQMPDFSRLDQSSLPPKFSANSKYNGRLNQKNIRHNNKSNNNNNNKILPKSKLSNHHHHHHHPQQHNSDQSEYDNVNSSNGSHSNSNNKMLMMLIQRDTRSLEASRFLSNGEESDAMSGYVGDVASSVYDSEDYCYEDELSDRKPYYNGNVQDDAGGDDYEYDEDLDDPMAPFFPKLPNNGNINNTNNLTKNCSSGRASSSAGGSGSNGTGVMRSDYDNVESDQVPMSSSSNQSRKSSTSNTNTNTKEHHKSGNFQLQIAEEARKISRIYRKQWTNDISNENDLHTSEERLALSNATEELDNPSRSTRETSADSLDSPPANYVNLRGNDDSNEGRCQSTDCVLTNNNQLDMSDLESVNGHHQSEPLDQRSSVNQNPVTGVTVVNSNNTANLSRIRERADKVRSLLPQELHQYVLPGCFSNSSVSNNDDDVDHCDATKYSVVNGNHSQNHSNSNNSNKVKNTKVTKKHHKKAPKHFSDEERQKRSI